MHDSSQFSRLQKLRIRLVWNCVEPNRLTWDQYDQILRIKSSPISPERYPQSSHFSFIKENFRIAEKLPNTCAPFVRKIVIKYIQK